MSNQYRALADEIVERVTNREDFISGRLALKPPAEVEKTPESTEKIDGSAAVVAGE